MLDKRSSPYGTSRLTWSYTVSKALSGRYAQMHVACAATIDVPAYSELELVVETTEHAEATWLLEGVASDKLPVVVVRAVVSPTDGCAVARLISPTAKVVRVHRGTRLGQVEQLLDSAVVSVIMEGQSSCEVAPGNGASNKTLLEMMQQDGDGSTLSQTQRNQLLQMLKKHWKPFAEGAHDHGQTNRV